MGERHDLPTGMGSDGAVYLWAGGCHRLRFRRPSPQCGRPVGCDRNGFRLGHARRCAVRVAARLTSRSCHGPTAACDQFDTSYTLYRDSMALEKARIHVASFDAADGAEYNAENCRVAQDLFASQPGVKVRYWCEKGRFKR